MISLRSFSFCPTAFEASVALPEVRRRAARRPPMPDSHFVRSHVAHSHLARSHLAHTRARGRRLPSTTPAFSGGLRRCSNRLYRYSDYPYRYSDYPYRYSEYPYRYSDYPYRCFDYPYRCFRFIAAVVPRYYPYRYSGLSAPVS
jgi:hypothetical protein